jgi:NCS2 family nucleobase:cation symporter-2
LAEAAVAMALETVPASEAHPVDARPAAGRLVLLAFQHVLTMYAGAVTVPLVLGAALHPWRGAR